MVIDWMILNMVEGLGPARIKRLLERYGSPEAALAEAPGALVDAGVLTPQAAQALCDGSLRTAAERQLETAQAAGVLVLTPGDERFPPLLHEIFAPPPVLFVKGNLDVFSRHAVGIVGTRHPTPYGIRAAGAISRELAQAGIAVVSGLALGIDTAAHQACLEAGGCTIAVLGCGVDVIYPPSNHALADRITEQGAIVSEFALGTKPLGHHFPRRNRIISGLSAGVLVVEAGEKSGALITANFALQQGREVFALPGPVFSDKSAGTFNLIKSGATPVRSGADILESIQTVRLNSVANQRVSFPFAEDLLSTEERSLLGHLGDAPLRVDELAGASGLPVSALLDALLNLELKGAVRQLAGQQFVRMGS